MTYHAVEATSLFPSGALSLSRPFPGRIGSISSFGVALQLSLPDSPLGLHSPTFHLVVIKITSPAFGTLRTTSFSGAYFGNTLERYLFAPLLSVSLLGYPPLSLLSSR